MVAALHLEDVEEVGCGGADGDEVFVGLGEGGREGGCYGEVVEGLCVGVLISSGGAGEINGDNTHTLT